MATSNPSTARNAIEDTPTTELMRQVLDETRELVRLETRLARDELQGDLVQLKSAAIFGGAALLLGVLTLSTLLVAVILALGASAGVAFIVAAALLLGACVLAGLAYQRLPKPPLARTRERLTSDVTQLKEHI
ncbi:MAG TPA: phage holin family protein, partial [Polyangiaceae bacterium]|nr:phage holin family protein [Polyangiaceae bacterium]